MFGTEPCSRVFHIRRPRAPALGVAWSFSFLPPRSFGGILLRGLRVRDRHLSSYSTRGTKRVKKTSKEWSLNQNPTPPEAAFPIPPNHTHYQHLFYRKPQQVYNLFKNKEIYHIATPRKIILFHNKYIGQKTKKVLK